MIDNKENMAQVNNQRILKNTTYLYLRMFLGLVVSLFTARVILDALGAVDYGLNHVVGGLVTMFSFVNGSLSSSTSRFISYEIGKGNDDNLSRTFSNAFVIHFALAAIVVALGETIGVYIVNNVMNIPADRLSACDLLWQCVLLGVFLKIVTVPMNAMIIAFEKMGVYACVGLFDIIARLLVVFLVKYSPYDKLVSLALLNALVSLIDFAVYYTYTKLTFSLFVSYSLKCEMPIIRKMLRFTIWEFIGSTAVMLRTAGVNLLLNLFFSPIANAANAIAYRVNSAIVGFTANFTKAANPQIIKSYAAEEFVDMKKLIMRSGKITYYLLMLLSFPVIFECDYILHLWLGDNVPEDAVVMTKLVLVISMIDTFTYSIGCAVQATGQVKNYQLVVSGINLLAFPLSWVSFKLGMPVYSGLVVVMVCSLVSLGARMPFLKNLLHISPSEYILKVFLRVGMVSIVSLIPPFVLVHYIVDSGVRCVSMVLLTTIVSLTAIMLCGLEGEERAFVKDAVSKHLKK